MRERVLNLDDEGGDVVQKRWNVIALNAQGRVIAGKTNIRSEKERNHMEEMYYTDAKVESVKIVEFEVTR